jgi:hypothetical protein
VAGADAAAFLFSGEIGLKLIRRFSAFRPSFGRLSLRGPSKCAISSGMAIAPPACRGRNPIQLNVL